VAKFRAARRIWAHVMRDEFGARDPRSMMLRFHTQTAGVQLTAQQPELNLVRVTLQALGAVLGGTQSLHTNGYDEAIALPTEKAARLALRTQQVLAHETDLAKTVDPFAGSYAVEAMTDALERAAVDLMARVQKMGGALAAVESGFERAQIEEAAYQVAVAVSNGERIVVGVNAFESTDDEPYRPLRLDPGGEAAQVARLATLRRERDGDEVAHALATVGSVAATSANVLPAIKIALAARATLGEVCRALRDVWGDYEPT
jgi:methylmalonyl-CoA mutase, N-terminal domain